MFYKEEYGDYVSASSKPEGLAGIAVLLEVKYLSPHQQFHMTWVSPGGVYVTTPAVSHDMGFT